MPSFSYPVAPIDYPTAILSTPFYAPQTCYSAPDPIPGGCFSLFSGAPAFDGQLQDNSQIGSNVSPFTTTPFSSVEQFHYSAQISPVQMGEPWVQVLESSPSIPFPSQGLDWRFPQSTSSEAFYAVSESACPPSEGISLASATQDPRPTPKSEVDAETAPRTRRGGKP